MMNRREFCGGVVAFATPVGKSVAAEGQEDWATVDGMALPD